MNKKMKNVCIHLKKIPKIAFLNISYENESYTSSQVSWN